MKMDIYLTVLWVVFFFLIFSWIEDMKRVKAILRAAGARSLMTSCTTLLEEVVRYKRNYHLEPERLALCQDIEIHLDGLIRRFHRFFDGIDKTRARDIIGELEYLTNQYESLSRTAKSFTAPRQVMTNRYRFPEN